MRYYDFAPLSRSSIGFDRLFDLINDSQDLGSQDNHPPYDIRQTDEDNYVIALALPGFSPKEVTITAQQNRLTVAGEKADSSASGQTYLHQGIQTRPFEQHFNLADHVEVQDASFENGLLEIRLHRRIPETMKPRRIEIGESQQKPDRAKMRSVT